MSVTAQYTSPTHSHNVTHALNPSGGSQKSSLEALRQAVLSTQADLNVYLTERKLEEDRANGVNGTATKRKKRDEEDEEDAGDGDEDVAEEDE